MERKTDVHIISPFWNPSGGTEWHAVSLYEELKPLCAVHLWTESETPAEVFARRYPIKKIDLRAGEYPKKGIFIFAGAFHEPSRWIFFAFPKKIFVSYTTFNPERLAQVVKRLSLGVVARTVDYLRLFDLEKLPRVAKSPALGFFRSVEVMYASNLLKQTVDYPGIVELSPVDLNQFVPAERTTRSETDKFVVGRLSRDEAEKHHDQSVPVYLELANKYDCKVRIMGGTCIAPQLAAAPQIEILPANSMPPAEFLQSLDCFYYRTADSFTETFGRVVFEAMACALPVVCHNRGGYVEFIESGRNGFVFDTEPEALEIILELKKNQVRRRAIGKAARATVEEMFSPQARREIIDYYLR